MNIVMLAAGVGKRFNHSPNNTKIPKCIINLDKVNNKSILELNIENIKFFKCIQFMNIVVGFKHEMVSHCLENISLDHLNINLKYNENYEKSVLFSVEKGFEGLKGNSILLLNGDTYFSKKIFLAACDLSIKKENGITLFGFITNNIDDDDMLIETVNNKIKSVGKHLNTFNGISSGAILISGDELETYLKTLKNIKKDNPTHHGILQKIISQGGKVDFHNIGDRDWVEVDDVSDLKKMTGIL